MTFLDTNVVIAFLNGTSEAVVERFRREVLAQRLRLSVVTLFELRYGVAKSARRRHNADRLEVFLQLPLDVVPFDGEDAGESGQIRAQLEHAGTPIGPYDLLIAAQARRRSALLVTANSSEFSRVPGLATEDWSQGPSP